MNKSVLTKDPGGKKLQVVEEFDVPVAAVWEAWTTPELLDQWWAPKPWKAETKSMDFREGEPGFTAWLDRTEKDIIVAQITNLLSPTSASWDKMHLQTKMES